MSGNKKRRNLTKTLIIISLFLALSGGAVLGYNYIFKENFKPLTEEKVEKGTDTNVCSSDQGRENEICKNDQFQIDGLKKKDAIEIETTGPKINPSCDYSNLYPNLYVSRPAKQFSPSKTAFLTFDDGPSERTVEILNILKENEIKATFFVVGNTSPKGKELMKKIVEEGHTLAPHTYTHNFKKIYANVESFLSDFNDIYNLIYETTGQKPGIFRFAGGSKNGFNKGNYREIIAEMRRRGFDYFDWNISSGDAAQKTPTPAQKCMANVVSNSNQCNSVVVLMHDTRPKTTTVEALPDIIKGLKQQGFEFDKLSHSIYPGPFSLIKPYI